MDQLGTYRGYDIAVTLHSNGESKTPKWHSSIQIKLVGKAVTEPCFSTDPKCSTVSEARILAVRTAKLVIDGRPNAASISDDDLFEE